MRLGGFLKNSFIDYPGKVGCVLFTAGCNYHCPYCHNPELVIGAASPVAPDAVLEFLESRVGLLDGVVISGGEPTLQAGLPAFCSTIRKMGFPIKLDTNGSRPAVLDALLASGDLDYVAMDLKTDPRRYAPLISEENHPEALMRSIDLLRSSGVDHEFRITCVRPLLDRDILRDLCALIKGAPLLALQQCRTDGAVLNGAFFEEESRLFTESELAAFRNSAADWVQRCILR